MRPAVFPVGVFLIASLVIGYGARASASFFVALDSTHPWLGITIFVVLIGAILSALLYWLLPRV